MINQEKLNTYLDVVADIEAIITVLKENYPSKYEYTRPLKHFKVLENKVTGWCESNCGDEYYIEFPISYLYLSKEELIEAIKAEQIADKVKSQLLKEEREERQKKEDLATYNRLQKKYNL